LTLTSFVPSDSQGLHGKDAWLEKEQFNQSVNVLRNRLSHLYKGVVHPHSWLMTRWDVAMVIALLFTTFVTPFEVCLGEVNPDLN
jgi:hypothetical protein